MRAADDRGVSSSPSSTGPRSWFRRAPAPDDSVVISADSSHDWWAGRDQLTRPTPAASSATEAAPRAFAPAPDPGRATIAPPPPPAAPTVDPPERQRWDVNSLFEWAATTTPVREAPAQGDQVPLAWLVFGLTPEAEWEQVVARHRVLAKRYHPDRHASRDEHTRARLERRMAEINAAFADLIVIYGVRRGA